MPPKKKTKTSTATKAKQSHTTMWLVTLSDNSGYGESKTVAHALYDSLDKAKKSGINLMDANSPWGMDWRNGLAGLGKENGDDYIGFEYNPDLGTKGGELLSNEDSDMSHTVAVSIQPLQINPPSVRVSDQSTRAFQDEEEECGFIFH